MTAHRDIVREWVHVSYPETARFTEERKLRARLMEAEAKTQGEK